MIVPINVYSIQIQQQINALEDIFSSAFVVVSDFSFVWIFVVISVSFIVEKILFSVVGSVWGNLAYNKTTKCLEYMETKDQDPVALKSNYVAILCIDGWEHAWYLQYQNVKKTYYTEIWKIINWKDLEQRYQEALKN